MDNLSKWHRSYCMSRIKSKDTKPEMLVRRIIHRMGCRFRLHKRELPGCPDLVFSSKRKIIFVHGCFWHKHRCKSGKVKPATNTNYWEAKINNNHTRDLKVLKELKRSGWEILVVWECWTKNIRLLREKIKMFMGKPERTQI